MLFIPVVLNDVVNAAVPPANVEAVTPDEVTATGLPIAVPPLKNVTVPVGPCVLTLCVAIVAVSIIGDPAGTVVRFGATDVLVAAFATAITGLVTPVVMGL